MFQDNEPWISIQAGEFLDSVSDRRLFKRGKLHVIVVMVVVVVVIVAVGNKGRKREMMKSEEEKV
jgi:hypothetical protein